MSMEQAEPEERSTGSEESLLDRMVPNGDDTLRRAEGRVQGAESKAAELEAELASMRAANVRMEEQLKRLWGQLGMPTEGPGSSKSPIAPRRARQAQTEQPALDGHTSAWADETALEPPPVASEGPDYSAHGEEEAEPGEALGAHETRYLANSHVSVGVPALQEGTVPGPEEPLEEPHQRSEQAWAMPGAPGPDEPTVQAGGPAGDLTAGSASEELARVLVAAEQAAARIVDVAQARAKGELAEIDRRAREVQAEADRAWRTWSGISSSQRRNSSNADRKEPIIDSARSRQAARLSICACSSLHTRSTSTLRSVSVSSWALRRSICSSRRALRSAAEARSRPSSATLSSPLRTRPSARRSMPSRSARIWSTADLR